MDGNLDRMRQALRMLSAWCDGARSEDGMGFNKFDAERGRSLAAAPTHLWSDADAQRAYNMVRRYQGQLRAEGFDVDAITKPAHREPHVIDFDGENFTVRHPKNWMLVKAMRECPGRSFDWERTLNVVPPTASAKTYLMEFADQHAFEVTDVALNILEREGDEIVEGDDEEEVGHSAYNVFPHTCQHGSGLGVAFDDSDGDFWAMVDALREVPGRRWLAQDKLNYVPLDPAAIDALKSVIERYDFSVDPHVIQLVAEALDEADDNLSASIAMDSEFHVDGLGGTLRGYQAAGVEFMIRNQKCINADEMGTGKTIQALAAAEAAGAFPFIVICPATLKYNWEREARIWLRHRATYVVNGGRDAEYGHADIVILNYAVLSKHVRNLRRMLPNGVAFDESHYVKNRGAKRSQAADDLVNGHLKQKNGRRKPRQRKIPYVWLLTGTPVLNRAIELTHPLKIIGALQSFGGFKKFAHRYTNAEWNGYGYSYDGSKNTKELNTLMRQRGYYIRRTKDQVLPDLPDKMPPAPILVKIDNWSEYVETAKDTNRWFANRAVGEQEFLESIRDLSFEDQAYAIQSHHRDAEYRASRAEALTRISALKQVSAKGKINVVVEWAKNMIETGEKVVIFAVHKRVVRGIAQPLGAMVIDGSTPNKKRQEIVDRFQNDPNEMVLVMNMESGGVGLTLTAAHNVAFVELGWNPAVHDQATDRCHRIGQKNTVTPWYFIGKDTIDDWIMELLDEKREEVEATTDGKDVDADNMLTKLVERILEQGWE